MTDNIDITEDMHLFDVQLNEDYSWPEPLEEPPFAISSEMENRLDPAYVKFYKQNVAFRQDLVETYKFPVSKTKAGGNVIPGQPEPIKMAKIYDIDVPRTYYNPHNLETTIKARVYVPKGDMPENGWPLLAWLHGGGWVLGNINSDKSFCTYAADTVKCIVISTDYGLAPEVKFPGGIEDSIAAILYYMYEAKSLNIDNTKIAVGGNSAGASMTAVFNHEFCASEHFNKLPPIKLQLCIAPSFDNSATFVSYKSWRENKNAPQLTAKKIVWYRKVFLPQVEDWTNKLASPIYYPASSFKNLPPTEIYIGECDVLRDECVAYHKKTLDAGSVSNIHIVPGCQHSILPMATILKQSMNLRIESCEKLKDVFSNN